MYFEILQEKKQELAQDLDFKKGGFFFTGMMGKSEGGRRKTSLLRL